MSNHAAKDREPLKQSRPSPGDALADRKRRFEKIVTEAGRKNAWVTSVSGAELVTFDALEGSPLAADLRERGFEVTDEGWGERILAVGITEKFARGPGGELVPITEGSTRPIAETRRHAGIVRIRRFAFNMS